MNKSTKTQEDQKVFYIFNPDRKSNGLYIYAVLAFFAFCGFGVSLFLFVISIFARLNLFYIVLGVAIVPVVAFVFLGLIYATYNAYKQRTSGILKRRFTIGSRKLWVTGRLMAIQGYYITPIYSSERFFVYQNVYYSLEEGFEVEVEYFNPGGKVTKLTIINTNNKPIPNLSFDQMKSLDNKDRVSAGIEDLTSLGTIYTIIGTCVIFAIWYSFIGLLYLLLL